MRARIITPRLRQKFCDKGELTTFYKADTRFVIDSTVVAFYSLRSGAKSMHRSDCLAQLGLAIGLILSGFGCVTLQAQPSAPAPVTAEQEFFDAMKKGDAGVLKRCCSNNLHY